MAEQAILLMLGLLRKVHTSDNQVRIGPQILAKETMIINGISELGDCRVGLIGLGAIGTATSRLLNTFGCEVQYFKRHRLSSQEEADLSVSYSSVQSMLKECDIISLHVPVSDETENMVDTDFLKSMKSSAFLINTSRGELVDQEALKQALIAGEIAGAGLDTLSPEPVMPDNPLLNLPDDIKDRVLFSPHIGGTTLGAFKRMHQGVWNNINRVIEHRRPVNIVNGL